MRKLFMLCVLLGWLGAAAQAAERVRAYYPFWVSYSQTKALADLPLARLDQLTYAFAYFDAQGQLQAGDAFADLNKPYPQADGTLLRGNYALLKAIKPQYPQLKTVLAVGGWNYSAQFSAVLADPVLRQRAVQSTLQFLQQHGFDGIEIDWRYPGGGGRDGNSASLQDGAHLLQFVRALRQAAPQLIIGLTSAVQPAIIAASPWRELAPHCDYVMLIATDFVGAWSGKTSHKSPLYMPAGRLSIDLAVNTLIDAGLPANQLALMIPSQGVSFNGVNAQGNGLAQTHGGVSMGSWDNAQTGPTGVFGQDEIAALQQGQGFVEHWDALAQESYFYSPRAQQFISIETERALAAKLDYVQRRGLQGIALWEITSDARAHSLLRQIEVAAVPLRAYRNDVRIWWQQNPSVIAAVGSALLCLMLIGLALFGWRLHRARQQAQWQWQQVRQIKDVIEVLPAQLARLSDLTQAPAIAELPAPAQTVLQQLHINAEGMAWQLNAVNSAVAIPLLSVEESLAPTELLSSDAPSEMATLTAFSQFSQRLNEQRSLEKMLEVTAQFLAEDPRVAAAHWRLLDDEGAEQAPTADAGALCSELDDYLLSIEFKSRLSEREQAYFQSVLEQLQVVRRSLYALARQPQLLAELYEIASRRDKLQFIRAEKGYSAIVAQDLRAPAYITLRLRAIRLYFDEAQLIQVHRSYLVNPKKVKGAQKRGREGWVLLAANETVPVSRQYIARLKRDYPQWFQCAEAVIAV